MRSAIKYMAAAAFCTVAFGAQAAFAEHAAAPHGDAAHASGGMPQFDIATFPSQIFWLAVTFIVMYAFFSARVLPDISGVLENRRNHIQSDLDTAERLKAEAEDAQQTYEKSLSEARSAATKTMVSTHEKIKVAAEKKNVAFQEKSLQEISAMENRIANTRDDLLAEMNTIVAEVSSEAAARIVGIKPNVKQASKVVEALTKKKAA